MSVSFVTARPEEAKELSELRRKVWSTTYRGIYPDDMIDNFDYPMHNAKDLTRITAEDFTVYFITENGEKIGYLILQKKEILYVQSLYLLENFRGKGIGRAAFEKIREFCRKNGYDRFYLGCHPQNEKAIGFYLKMGGVITARDEGHEHNEENSIRIDFEI
ncbi:MAG: GNAT family N-acetyltransferase [Oscillospiraceae bacterium]|nr:GNAT family N-acetyltransferase [Oscillospiraceae bacterium]